MGVIPTKGCAPLVFVLDCVAEEGALYVLSSGKPVAETSLPGSALWLKCVSVPYIVV